MIRKQHGFTLVEMMVAMVIFTLGLAAAAAIFIPLLGKFKQQTKIAETNIEGLVGLEMLKTDLEQAGYGLPWYFPNNNTITYTETAATPASSAINGAVVNDAPGNPPRAVAAFNNVTYNGQVNSNTGLTGIVNGSDYLVIKSILVSGTDASRLWSYIVAQNAPNTRVWDTNNPATNDCVIIINPVASSACPAHCLVMNGTAFASAGYTLYSSAAFPAAFSPSNPTQDPLQTFLIFDVAPAAGTAGTTLTGPLTMPFNRADYFVGIPAALPARCASGTGVLYKAVLSQDNTFHASNTTALLDCVADMQVVFGLDLNGNGTIGTYSNADGSYATDATPITGEAEGLTAKAPTALQSNVDLSYYRSSLAEVRVYVLAHEGQMDPNYTYPNNTILVGENTLDPNLGRNFNLATSGIVNWQNYRWKVYTIVVKLQNMR